jgi:intein/homing endonuclease
MMVVWADLYKSWSYALRQGPIEKQTRSQQISGAGVTQPEAIPDIRQDGSFWGGGRGLIRLRDTNDFIDLSSVTNRQSRYKEYERLRSVPEIEMAMNAYADEACLAGHTIIHTPFYGPQTIRWLAEHHAGERFLVYCWDFEKEDFTLGWASNPHKVKTCKTIRVKLSDGSTFSATPDHRVLLSNLEWIQAGELKNGDELLAFIKVLPKQWVNDKKKIKTNQFPRIYTHQDGWKHERRFIDEWRTGAKDPHQVELQKGMRLVAQGVPVNDCPKFIKHEWKTVESWMHKEGFTLQEVRMLENYPKSHRVIAVEKWTEMDVYDMSVEKHMNMCGESVVFHNCQKGENGHVFRITCDNEEVQEELEWLFFNRKMLNIDDPGVGWNWFKRLCINGDVFLEAIMNTDNPKDGILKLLELPPDSMFRIETTKARLVEFQQSKEGPDYQSLTRAPVTSATEADLMQTTALRFTAEQIIHIRLGDDRKTFYPYGVSLVEAARGPAHQLRLMEDSMVIYRLCLVGDTRVRTKNGWKYIKDLKIGDDVFSYIVSNNEIINAKVVAHKNNGVQKTYTVSSKHIQITGNETHPILINRDGTIKYVLIKDLIPGKDKLITVTQDEEVPIKIPSIFGEKWAKISSIQRTVFRNSIYENKLELMRKCGNIGRIRQFLYTEGKALPLEQALKICDTFDLDSDQLEIVNKGQVNSERINLPEYVDEEFARLFGFLIGDGSIRAEGIGYANSLRFAGGVDEEQNQYYAGLLEKYFGKVRFDEDKRSAKKLGNYTVDSQIACRVFLEMGYIPGAKNKRIPDWVFTASKSIRRAFVEGISDADGCERYTKAGTWFSTIEICNQKLTGDIKEIWSSIGLCSGKLGHRKRKGGHEIEPGRKMKPTESFFVTISDCELPKYENVLSVEFAKEQEVYDVTVDNSNENFIANNTIVHNTRAPERRVFYIDVGSLSPARAEGFMERVKDQFRKKKVATATAKSASGGASSVEERWHPPAADEDFWLPIRPNSNTRIETLPGAANLGEIDDALYFRNKLFIALNIPKNYFANEDPQSTRISLSAQDARFARVVERLQASFERSLAQIAELHLRLLGVPDEDYEDLQIHMTPPSNWQELSRNEIITNRINNANGLKGSMLMSDFDILTKFMQYSEEDAQKMIARMRIQKLEDFKLQVLAQNPQLLGVGTPGPNETEMGAAPGGPAPMLGPDMGGMGAPPPMGAPPGGPPPMPAGAPPMPPPAKLISGSMAEPTPEEIKKYDLDIKSYDSEMDAEEVDFSEA